MKICMLTSGHDIFDNRIYYKEILSLKRIYNEIYLVAPGEKDFITKDGIIVKCFEKRKSWHDRIRPMKDMFNIAKEINADVYHAHEPDSFQVAIKLKKVLGCKAVYDSHEYYPEAFSEHFPGIKGLMQKAIYIYEKNLGKQADYIVTVNQLLVNKFKEYNGNVEMLPNYPTLSAIGEKNLEKKYNDKPTFIYVGGLREDRGIFKIVEAIELVKQDYKFLFVGPFENAEFEKKVKDFINSRLKDREIIFTGKVPHLEVFKYLQEAWAGFVLLQPNNWRYVNSEPIKIFEYMVSKTAVVGSNYEMMRNLVEKSQCGLLADPEDITEIARAIEFIGKDLEKTKKMSYNGYNNVKEIYNWSTCEERLIKIYKHLEKK